MLKLNTVLTGACSVLLILLGFLGKAIWDDVATIKNAYTTTAAQVVIMAREMDDHESRIRQNEKDIIVLQQDGRDSRTARSPKMSENKP